LPSWCALSYMSEVHFFERKMGGRRYRIAAQSVWDSSSGRSVARQVVLGPADPPPQADLDETRTVGTRAVGDVGALLWVAEQLDLVGHIDRACPGHGAKRGPSVGEMVLAVAVQRVCAPGPKRDLAQFLDDSLPRVSCLHLTDVRAALADRRDLREFLLGLFPRGLTFSPARTPDNSRAVWKLSGPAIYKVLSRRTPSGTPSRGGSGNSNGSGELDDPAEPALPKPRRDPNGIWRGLEREIMVELVLAHESIR